VLLKKLARLLTLTILGSSLYSCAGIPQSVERPCPTACGSFGPGLGGRCKELCTNQAWDLSPAAFNAFVHPQVNVPGQPDRAGATCYSPEDNTALITFGDEVCAEIKCTKADRAWLEHLRRRVKGLEKEGLRALKTRKRPPLMEY
jgi:hypothetical protein